ncbi:MAG: phosphomannomutase/phosphoglucomutase [Streptosporangiales bacterium]|nr:phosphomannomutase/phosphoglucomutase [Streptosporangiales bacterium]
MSSGQLAEIFKAYDVRGVVPDQWDATAARRIGAAFATVVEAAGVVVGHDMRPSSPELAAAFAEGAAAAGADVTSIGLASTDMLYFASGRLDLPGAMFTASHNPARYNGIKFCRSGARPISQATGLTEIRELAEGGGPAPAPRAGTVATDDQLTAYAEFLRSLVPLHDVRPLRVAVDAANGMAGHTAPAVFAGTPVEVLPLYFELDGTFPNHEANPLEPANLRDLQAFVRETGADCGLAFDGDADRCFVVDEHGESVSPSALTALIAVRELAREPGARVIHNLITSKAVPELVRAHGGEPVRTRVGHSFIKAEMAKTQAVFGGEHSAHYYFRDFWYADSGMLAALHLLAALGRSSGGLAQLLAEYARYAGSGEVNSEVADPAAALERVERAYAGQPDVTIDHLDGVTVSSADWWFNVRPSNTEPLVRLNVEAADGARLSRLRDEVLAVIRHDP